MKLCLSQCRSIYLYIDNVRARKSLSGKWCSKKLRETPGFSRGSAVDFYASKIARQSRIAACD